MDLLPFIVLEISLLIINYTVSVVSERLDFEVQTVLKVCFVRNVFHSDVHR